MKIAPGPVIEKPSQEEIHPDQMETLPFDASPVVRVFYGDTSSVGKVQAFPEPTQTVSGTKEEDPELAEILRARTRTLDSFAEDAMPDGTQKLSPDDVDPSLSAKTPEVVPRGLVPRSLTSVFDQEVELTRMDQQNWKAEVEIDETSNGRVKVRVREGRREPRRQTRRERRRERKKTPNPRERKTKTPNPNGKGGLLRRLGSRKKRMPKNHPNPSPESER